MKTQFAVAEICLLANGKVAITGSVNGPRLVAGLRGISETDLGEAKVEIISIGIVDSTRAKPNMQALQIRMLAGNAEVLKGATIHFE